MNTRGFDESKINRDLAGRFANKPGAETQPMSELGEDEPWEEEPVADFGGGLTPISRAQVQRDLPVGTKFQVLPIRTWDPESDTGEPALRTVESMSKHKMITRDPDGHTSPLHWGEVSTHRDDADNIIISHTHTGEPLFGIHRLADGEKPLPANAAPHPNLTGSTIKKDRLALAKNKHADQSTLSLLAKDPEEDVRAAVARNATTHPSTLNALAHDTPALAAIVAQNPSAHPDTLTELAQHPDPEVRYGVAENPSTLQSTLKILLRKDRGPEQGRINMELAANTNSPPLVLHELSQSKDWNVANLVARNPGTDGEDLARLASDKRYDNRVARGVAGNPAAPVALVASLSRSQDSWVRSGAAANGNLPAKNRAELIGDPHRGVRESVARNPRLTYEEAQTLARDPEPRVRARIAARADVPPRELERLRRDPDPYVRAALQRRTRAQEERESSVLSTTRAPLSVKEPLGAPRTLPASGSPRPPVHRGSPPRTWRCRTSQGRRRE